MTLRHLEEALLVVCKKIDPLAPATAMHVLEDEFPEEVLHVAEGELSRLSFDAFYRALAGDQEGGLSESTIEILDTARMVAGT